MDDQDRSRRRMVLVLVLAVLVLGLGAMLVIALVIGDDTDDQIEQQPDTADAPGTSLVGLAPAA